MAMWPVPRSATTRSRTAAPRSRPLQCPRPRPRAQTLVTSRDVHADVISMAKPRRERAASRLVGVDDVQATTTESARIFAHHHRRARTRAGWPRRLVRRGRRPRSARGRRGSPGETTRPRSVCRWAPTGEERRRPGRITAVRSDDPGTARLVLASALATNVAFLFKQSAAPSSWPRSGSAIRFSVPPRSLPRSGSRFVLSRACCTSVRWARCCRSSRPRPGWSSWPSSPSATSAFASDDGNGSASPSRPPGWPSLHGHRPQHSSLSARRRRERNFRDRRRAPGDLRASPRPAPRRGTPARVAARGAVRRLRRRHQVPHARRWRAVLAAEPTPALVAGTIAFYASARSLQTPAASRSSPSPRWPRRLLRRHRRHPGLRRAHRLRPTRGCALVAFCLVIAGAALYASHHAKHAQPDERASDRDAEPTIETGLTRNRRRKAAPMQ